MEYRVSVILCLDESRKGFVLVQASTVLMLGLESRNGDVCAPVVRLLMDCNGDGSRAASRIHLTFAKNSM